MLVDVYEAGEQQTMPLWKFCELMEFSAVQIVHITHCLAVSPYPLYHCRTKERYLMVRRHGLGPEWTKPELLG